MKIRHADTGDYIGVKDEMIIMSKSPQYWQVFDSFKYPGHVNEKMECRKYSGEQKIFWW